ncbi:unnamed protein product [Mytilus coruscus]|uniref:TIR domain-containing protein n=1 Tax=Mytilus coruscus TaxID=42192 RepID=A0A6J8AEN3_MYTCO|nr:unnamed protein product [Mytilus coruscus]
MVKLTQHLYQEFQNLRLNKSSNGTGLILPEVLQKKFQRGELRCQSSCNHIQCCICDSYYELEDYDILNLIKLPDFKSILSLYDTSTFSLEYIILSPNESLHSLPSNICDYPNIARVHLQYNEIKDIDLISCLKLLDTLILHHNLVEYFHKETFLNMTWIREIDLSHNRLKNIEPGFLINVNGNLFKFDVSYNHLTTLDITNILWTQITFCTANFSHNSINSITNTLKWKSHESSVFSLHGSMDVSFNNLTSFPIFNEHGINVKHAGKLYFWVMYLEGNPWNCDCQVYPIAKPSEMLINIFDNINMFMVCDSPTQLKMKTLKNIIDNSELDQLICNLSLAERCPSECTCFYQPALDNRTVVDCSGSGLTRIPSALPLYENLQIDFANNSISYLKRIEQFGLNFFENIKKLDLSNNQIITISDLVLYRFRKIQLINMTSNAIKRIPRSLQMLKPCQIALGQIIMKCECEDLWLKTWLPLQYQSCARNTEVLCEHNGLLRSITEINKLDLGCSETNNNASLINISICSACVAVIIIALIIFKLRSEFFILTRSFFNFVKKPVAPNCIKHDIYISADEDDPLLRKWLLTSLVPYLERKGFDVFLFFRDSAFGAPREQETIDVMSKSRNFIILLSDITNGNQEWNRKEWKYAWNYYKWDFSRNLIVINYDFVNCDDTVKKFFRGFFTLRKVIKFSNFDNKIEEDILTLLN